MTQIIFMKIIFVSCNDSEIVYDIISLTFGES